MDTRTQGMLTMARLALKQHRFEVTAAVLVAVAVSVAALVVSARLRAVDAPAGCLETARETFLEAEGCAPSLHAFASIDQGEAAVVLAAMGVVPFALGLLGGVPIVGRELEARTAQTVWSLSGSRLRWLLRQASPIVVVLGAAILLAALAADTLESARQIAARSAVNDLGLHGGLVVARAYAAFGFGLLAGAALGRTLPALVVGAVVSLALVFAVGQAREVWVLTLKPVLVETPNGSTPGWAGFSYGAVWIAPHGEQLKDGEAEALVPPDEPDASQWLLDHGYRPAELVVSEDVVLGWARYDALSFGLAGSVSLGAAGVVVNRRRPT
jgi:hypothetical protein